jgi:hypothetical protein
MKPAVASRLQGFRAGPEDHRFFACEEHRELLNTADPNFFLLRHAGVEELPVDEREDHDCDFCREGGA